MLLELGFVVSLGSVPSAPGLAPVVEAVAAGVPAAVEPVALVEVSGSGLGLAQAIPRPPVVALATVPAVLGFGFGFAVP